MKDYDLIKSEKGNLIQELLNLLNEYIDLNEAIIRFETTLDKSDYDKEEVSMMYDDFQEVYSEILEIITLLEKIG